MKYKELNEPDLLHEMGLDASKWAAAFCQLNPNVKVDEGLMITWFANAIMHTLDTERGTIINGEHAAYLQEKARERTRN